MIKYGLLQIASTFVNLEAAVDEEEEDLDLEGETLCKSVFMLNDFTHVVLMLPQRNSLTTTNWMTTNQTHTDSS